MNKNDQPQAPKRAPRISPELAEVLKMLSALENRDVTAPIVKSV